MSEIILVVDDSEKTLSYWSLFLAKRVTGRLLLTVQKKHCRRW
jgi:hypothetical protein